MLQDNHPEAEYKGKLNEYQSYEIDSPVRLHNTREILMNVWYYPDCSELVQYLMLCLTYPVFKDVCKIMGKLFDFNDEITNPALK